MMIRILLLIFLFSCVQTDNSHSGDEAQNTAIKNLDEILNKDPSQRTSSENAFIVLRQRCTHCHIHSSWELDDEYWLADNNFANYMEFTDGDPDSSLIIDRLRTWGKGLGPQDMPDDGYVLSEEEYNFIKSWVVFINQTKI